MTGWLVATDVDHTLLESPADVPSAGECLRELERAGATTLLASSKSFAEMVALHDEAGLEPRPFLFENGAGVGWPLSRWPAGAEVPVARIGPYGAEVTGARPDAIAALLRHARQREGCSFSLLGDWSAAMISEYLGITPAQARLALDRMATVPIVWEDDGQGLARLRAQLAEHHLTAVSGGRLVHVGPPGSKGEALERIRPWLVEQGLSPRHRVLACGDSENDRSLLESAEIAIVFQAKDAERFPGRRRPHLVADDFVASLRADTAAGTRRVIRTAVAGGPRQWLDAVEKALAAAGSELR